MVGERGPQRLRVAHERAAGLERRVQPLVRIDGHRVGLGERAQRRATHRAPPPRSHRTRRRRGTRRWRARQTAAISRSGSTAPVLTDPAVPTTMNGTCPARASVVDRSREGVDVHREVRRPPESTGRSTCRARQVGGLLNPGVRLGRAVDDQPAPASARPAARTSHGARAARAARKPTMFAMLPPLTSSPPAVVGIADELRRSSARSAPRSRSPPATASTTPTFGLSAAARKSPSMPIGAGDEVM